MSIFSSHKSSLSSFPYQLTMVFKVLDNLVPQITMRDLESQYNFQLPGQGVKHAVSSSIVVLNYETLSGSFLRQI